MLIEAVFVTASFTAPVEIGTNPQSILWLLPITAAIAVVYKATKLRKITAGIFLKEVAALFGSIIVFIIITASVLHILRWLITG